MEEALLLKAEEKSCTALVEELKKVSYMAAPMMVVSVSQYLLQVVSLMMAGHLGELSLSGVSIASSFTNVTGFNLLFGLAGALETLCGQAYGAGQYQKLGSYTYFCIVTLILLCFPVSVLWLFMDKILILLGQDEEISIEACKYAVALIPALFGYAWELGDTGAALAIGLSYWLNGVLLAFYMRRSSSCEEMRMVYWKEIIACNKEFFRFAVPSAIMLCLEWWTFEILILLAGLLQDSQLETSVLSICLSITTLHYYIQYGIGAAASTRVSNELGAGNPRAARGVVCVALVISVGEAVVVSTILFCCRKFLGYAFSNTKEVVYYVTQVTPLLCLSIFMDGLQAVLSEIARGCGWQNIGAFLNLGAYYLVGVPVSVTLCFICHLQGKGLWIGIISGSIIQASLFALVTALTNWEKQAMKARERITGDIIIK